MTGIDGRSSGFGQVFDFGDTKGYWKELIYPLKEKAIVMSLSCVMERVDAKQKAKEQRQHQVH